MPDFSAFIPETNRDISSGYVETLIQARREELFTGLMRLHYSSGESLVFFFLEGNQQKLYRCTEDTVDVIPKQLWSDSINRSSLSAGFLRLPLEGIRLLRVAYEAPVVRVEKSIMAPERFIEMARKWASEPKPSIVHVQGDAVNKLYLIAGNSTPVVEELFFGGAGGARFSIIDASFTQTLPSVEYSVTRYIGNPDNETWQQYELRIAFTPLFRMLLGRFGELAGRALMGRLCERLSIWAAENDWNVAITSNGIVDRQYFETLENSVKFYADLIRCFQAEASPALGPRLVDGISRDVLVKLSPHHRELIIRHIYSQSGVGSAMSAMSAV